MKKKEKENEKEKGMKKEKENEIEKENEKEKENEIEKLDMSPETTLDTSDIELKCIFKPKIKSKKAFKIKPKKNLKKKS